MNAESARTRILLLHGGLILALFLAQFVLPAYHHGVLARIMVLAAYAMGYNILFGYTGLLSLGHAMFFAAGLYGAGLTVYHLGWPVPLAFLAGLAAGGLLAVVIGFLALILYRQIAVAFMANPGLNGLILGVLAIGILLALRQVFRLFREVRWVNALNAGRAEEAAPPVLLAPVAAILGEGGTRRSISTLTLRALLDSRREKLQRSAATPAKSGPSPSPQAPESP